MEDGRRLEGVAIKPIRRRDYAAWLPLWTANHPEGVTAESTNEAWRCLTDKKEPVFGLGAWHDDTLQGYVHYVLHPVVGSSRPVCYMQDIFIVPGMRRQGLARTLIRELSAVGKRENWAWIYWFALDSNAAAQSLYKKIGLRMEMSVHMIVPGING